MLTRIIHHSPALCNFYDQLELSLSQPQRQHFLNMADALLVCEDKKTLAALQRQFLEAPDPSNMADFLRISPWSAEEVRTALRVRQVAGAVAQAEKMGFPHVLFINLDDSLGEKDKDTSHLEPVDWFPDHRESTNKRPRFKKGLCYVVGTLRIGSLVVTVDVRLYLRAKTVRRLNRRRAPDRRVRFRSKYRLVRLILESLRPLLPSGWTVYV